MYKDDSKLVQNFVNEIIGEYLEGSENGVHKKSGIYNKVAEYLNIALAKSPSMMISIIIPDYNEIESKGNGRIFTPFEEDIPKIHDIMKDLDKEEFEGYMPKDYVAQFNYSGGANELIYTHKFDIDIKELVKRCRAKNIYIKHYSCNAYNYKDGLTLEEAVQQKLGIHHIDNFEYGWTKKLNSLN